MSMVTQSSFFITKISQRDRFALSNQCQNYARFLWTLHICIAVWISWWEPKARKLCDFWACFRVESSAESTPKWGVTMANVRINTCSTSPFKTCNTVIFSLDTWQQFMVSFFRLSIFLSRYLGIVDSKLSHGTWSFSAGALIEWLKHKFFVSSRLLFALWMSNKRCCCGRMTISLQMLQGCAHFGSDCQIGGLSNYWRFSR